MKKSFPKYLFYVAVAVVVFLMVALAFQYFYDVIIKIGGGSFILGIVLTPFVIIGCINVLRGFGAVVGMDEEKYGHKLKDWKFGIYLVLHIGGYLALFYALIRCV